MFGRMNSILQDITVIDILMLVLESAEFKITHRCSNWLRSGGCVGCNYFNTTLCTIIMSSYISSKVSSYKLLVQAFDSGSPAMSTAVTVNIDIADVNDNAPVFSPENASAVIQVCVHHVYNFILRNCNIVLDYIKIK